MTKPKWEIGPVKLADGTEGHIDFVQPESNHHRYIGRAKNSDGEWRSWQWSECGRVPYTTTGHAKNLAPPLKKKVRLQRWAVVYFDGSLAVFFNQVNAIKEAKKNGFALLEIDREVEEGEGL